MPNVIVGDGSTLEEGCILDHVTFRHHPRQTPAQRAGAGGIFPRHDMMSVIGSDGARPAVLAWPGQVSAIKHLPSQATTLISWLSRRRRRRRSLSSLCCYSCPHLSKKATEDRTQNSVTEAKTSRRALPVSWDFSSQGTASGRKLPAMSHRSSKSRLPLG